MAAKKVAVSKVGVNEEAIKAAVSRLVASKAIRVTSKAADVRVNAEFYK